MLREGTIEASDLGLFAFANEAKTAWNYLEKHIVACKA